MSNKLFVRQDVGKGDPLVLLHGMFADGSQWDVIAKILSKDYRVIVVDLLGHGRSPRPKGATYSDKEHVSALRSTLESLGATKNSTVVGYSMGGAVALAYSSSYPESVEQLYLISTPFYFEPEQMIPNKYAGSILFTKVSTGIFTLIEKIIHPGSLGDKVVRFANQSSQFHKMIGANDNELDAQIISKNLEMLVHKFDFVGHLKRLKVPVTFYAGKKDIFIVQPQLNALRQYQPFMDIHRLDIIKVDHMLVQNLPKEICQFIKVNKQKLLHVSEDIGKGKPLILLHGIESSGNYWSPLIKSLAEKNRVITIDLLGFGESPKPLNIAYTLDDQVRYLEDTLQNLRINEFDVIAHSLGSLVALAYGGKYPKKVKSLTLLSPVFVPDNANSKNQIIKRLHFVDKISSGSYMYSKTAQALGYKRMAKYLPFIRSIQSAIRNQHSIALAKQAKAIPVKILYGENDGLIDKTYLNQVARIFKHAEVTSIPNQGHNFALFQPDTTLDLIYPDQKFKTKPKKASVIPPSFAKQLVKLASPALLFESIIYVGAGILLFTDFAPYIFTLGLAGYLFHLGYSYVRGAFSLKNEGFSYLGYILLGLLIVGFGWFFIKNTSDALKVSSLVIAGLVLLAGVARLIVGFTWVKVQRIKTQLLTTGVLMLLVGAGALAGGLFSIKVIVYTIAGLLMVRGIQFGAYATVAIVFAYIRGFNK
ncbi:alpha/beta fold hydrolase [Candidatus Saccharibacteria bacterium]|nr:alpha/beta fold hydrolase [Candidatus Saccharibacteria bacterium]